MRTSARYCSNAMATELLARKPLMYIDCSEIDIQGNIMALQIANPIDIDEVERVASATGLSKPGAVERAVGQPLRETSIPPKVDVRMATLLVQFDRIPDRNDAFDPLCWDKHGLPVHAVSSLVTE